MAKKEITSRPGLFGSTSHHDASGCKVGSSQEGWFGSTTHYDRSGHKVGRSEPGMFGSQKTKWDK